MSRSGRLPVIVAVGQTVERDEVVSPMELLERAGRAALVEAPAVERRIDHVTVVNCLSGGGPAPATALSRRLGLRPSRTETTTIGGSAPVWLLQRLAGLVAGGEVEAALVVGAETMRSRRERRHSTRHGAGVDQHQEHLDDPDPVVGDDRPGTADPENASGLILPAHIYPMFDSVLAHRSGRSFAEHRKHLGELMAPFTEVAANHPCAWFTEPATAAELAEPSAANRLVAEPYTKRFAAHLSVDQGAAYVVTTLAVAEELGLGGQAVFVWSAATADEVWFVPERPDLVAAPGMTAAARGALDAAGIDVSDVGAFDLYSCFPSAVELGAQALGLELDDHRGLTVTGGLPYFGGPGSNYSTHAIATMVDRLRGRGGLGVVTGMSWYASKSSVAVLGADPPLARGAFQAGDTAADQARIAASAILSTASVEEPTGATVEACTVVYTREGDVDAVPVIATLDDGRRTVARAELSEIHQLAGVNLVGERIQVAGSPPQFRVAG